MTQSDRPFSTIESTQKFLLLLSDEIDEALSDARREFSASGLRKQEQRTQAWRLVLYTITKLSSHIANSRKLMNDLLTLRNLLERNGAVEQTESVQTPTPLLSVTGHRCQEATQA